MHLPIIVAGGGIIGLLTLRELHKRLPQVDKALLEKGHYFGDLATGRNSGVMHAGLYYPKNSLKRKFCLEGNIMWEVLAKELGMAFERCGKYLVASTADEVDSLKELFDHASNNGVQGLRWVSDQEKEELSQYCYLEEAFFSPMSGYISPSEASATIRDDLMKKDLPLMADYEVVSVEKRQDHFIVKTSKEEFTCDIFVNAMGGHAPILRQGLGLNDIESFWVKGNYVKLTRKFYHDKLIYPVPPKGLKGLGVHTSFDFDGVVRFGPDTEDCSKGYEHSLRDDLVDEMYPAIAKLFKGISKDELAPDYCGIRSKIKRNGELYPDFWLGTPDEHNISGYYEFLGIESPGLTASPALSEFMAQRICEEAQKIF